MHTITRIACVAVAVALFTGTAVAEKLAVVVAKGSPVTSVSRADLKRAFGGDTVAAGGKKLVPFNFQPSTGERTTFDKAVLGMSPEQAGRYWVDRKVRGEGDAPRALPSAAHMVKVVAKFPGAIGYLPLSAVTADVQVVKVDGLAPEDAGYAIK